MAKRRQKKRTHVKLSEEDRGKIPTSMVIHLGAALENHTLTQLVKDTRNMMQPHTAIKLRERKTNKLKDFIVMAGPLGVSQLMVFSQNQDSGSTHLRMASMPRGPTVTFKIKEYSLSKDISRVQRAPKSVSKTAPEFLNPPLLVMNGFANPKNAEPHEKLVVTMFQNMFPPISPQDTKVGSIKRVLLLNKDPETGIIDLRHYVIDTKLVDVSRNVKKLVNIKKNFSKKLPNLAKVKDVSDIILDPYAQAGFTSDSEVEDDAVVEVEDEDALIKPKSSKDAATSSTSTTTTSGDNADQTQTTKRKKAVKLTEVGPRMKLDLVKIEDGVCDGKVLYHSYIKKTTKEINKLDQLHAIKKKERENRRKSQEANIAKKNEKKEAKKRRRAEAKARGEQPAEEDEESSESSDSEDDEPMVDSDGELFDTEAYQQDSE
ncbi:hypothetical protein CANARDRAFT_14938 [[Candida] arabinofermentans NRRL YB-2248]|uniref:Brix domain-containing protein n=1 Tax=[Candida] arabinofermentans NRRL YB-2248 TaxID=983967 RepID=A0A1E4T7F2_9ASCO|nr:hypothetical protein CANARDRAFT_14938 [[Candida] arabinofermentans NRRL YB-2248]